MCTCTHPGRYTHTNSHTHACPTRCARVRTHTHAYTYRCTHAGTHTHAYTYRCARTHMHACMQESTQMGLYTRQAGKTNTHRRIATLSQTHSYTHKVSTALLGGSADSDIHMSQYLAFMATFIERMSTNKSNHKTNWKHALKDLPQLKCVQQNKQCLPVSLLTGR